MEWCGDSEGYLRLLDQTRLPSEVHYVDCRSAEQVHAAIQRLSVRGAPAIGCAAAFGVCLGTREARDFREMTVDAFREKLAEIVEYLCGARPTAVNLAWAARRVARVADRYEGEDVEELWNLLLLEARAILEEDALICRQIGEHGAVLIPDGGTVLTHCNAGALATAAYGTALAAMYVAHERRKRFRVYADETRPLLQGARLTAFELAAAGIDVTVICDSAAASIMATRKVDLVIVGADRFAANGDRANKIGTYMLAVLAKHHGVPFYVAAPRSTFDLALASGAGIPIEQRGEFEVRQGFGVETVAPAAGVENPAFDVTPAELVTGIITEKGVLKPVTVDGIRQIFS